jgi:6-phosphogluconolactonase
MELHRFDHDRNLVQALAGRIADDLRSALSQRGEATLAVSGGSTPIPLFQSLSAARLDWSRVSITQVDERWVPEDHLDSNARLIREHLLQDRAAAARFISMKTQGADAFASEAESAAMLIDFAAGIDVVVLGMGEDGHTASFFPGADTLDSALDPGGSGLCLAVRPPRAPHDRMTLSLAALSRSAHRYLHITGDTKWQVLQQALQVGPVEELPIRAILELDGPPLHVYYAPRS